ncbi:MAG: CopD family protein, partial [Actinomycetes bacterium]
GSVKVYDPEGQRVDQGSPTGEASAGQYTVTTKVRDAGRGTYTVSYSVLSNDGHVVAGSFVYHAVDRTGTGEAVVPDEGPRRLGAVLSTLGRWLALSGSFVAGGVLCMALVLARRPAGGPGAAGSTSDRPSDPAADRAPSDPSAAGPPPGAEPAGPTASGWTGGLASARRLLVPAAAVTLFGVGFALLGRAVELSGQGPLSALVEVPDIVGGSWTGTVAGLRVLVALVLLVAVAGPVLLERVPWLAAVGIVATLALPSFGGHASTATLPVLAVVVDALHVLAAAAWVGGLAVVVLTWTDPGPPAAGVRVRAYSRMATVAAPVAVVTGVVRGWWITQSWAALTQTSGGKILMVKVLGVVVLLVMGWFHRSWLADRARSVAGILSSLRTEALVGVAVLAVTAVLVDARPPVEVVVRPFEGVATAGSTRISVEVTPASAGPNTVHVYFTDAAGAPAPVDAVELKVSSRSVEPRRVPLTTITASHVTATGVDLSPGRWTFRFIVVLKGEPDDARIEVPIQ